MSGSARVIFIMSTGRCSTQYLAKLLALGVPKAMVVHEGAGPNFKPAQVFRGNNFEDVVSQTHQLRDLFKIIDRQLDANSTFIETGWPAYAWAPYLRERYGKAFRFAHLVRNPFAQAASMSTHTLLGDGEDTLSKFGIIRPNQANALFTEFRSEYAGFSIFERGLYHWLEVNSFLLEQSSETGFLGLFRFEEQYEGDQPGAKELWEKCGFDSQSFQLLPPFDKFNCRTRQRFSPPNTALLTRVRDLALRLGYSEQLLEKWSDVNFLTSYYGRNRIQRIRTVHKPQ